MTAADELDRFEKTLSELGCLSSPIPVIVRPDYVGPRRVYLSHCPHCQALALVGKFKKELEADLENSEGRKEFTMSLPTDLDALEKTVSELDCVAPSGGSDEFAKFLSCGHCRSLLLILQLRKELEAHARGELVRP